MLLRRFGGYDGVDAKGHAYSDSENLGVEILTTKADFGRISWPALQTDSLLAGRATEFSPPIKLKDVTLSSVTVTVACGEVCSRLCIS